MQRHTAGAAGSVFTTVFEGYSAGQGLVRSVERLPVPAGEADNTVAVAVQTTAGTDYLVSCLQARPLALPTPDGLLEVSARFAAVSLRGGQLAAANLTEGSLLRLGGQAVSP